MTQAVLVLFCFFGFFKSVFVLRACFFVCLFFHTYLSEPYKTRNKTKLLGGFVAYRQIHSKEHKVRD